MNAARRPKTSQPNDALAFIQGFLRRPKEVASIVPSSRFLEKRIVRAAGLEDARTVVELGPGTGGTTRAFLRAMPADARLLAIEIVPRFAVRLRSTIRDPRLVVHRGSAQDLPEILKEYDLPAPDIVLSGIPFSTMEWDLGLGIVRAVESSLAPGGRFVAYQFRDRVEALGRIVFGRPSVQTELLNVPPMRVYSWDRAPA